MFSQAVGRRVGLISALTLFLVTVFVTPYSTLDPINVPKLWVLSAFTFAIGALLLSQFKALFSKKNWAYIGAARAVFVFMAISMFLSKSPFTQMLFGTNGRNTGLLTYFCFGTIFLGVALAADKKFENYFLIGAGGAFLVNALYGFIQAIGKDPQKWANPYAPVIGTLGNPDFASALLGMGVAFAVALAISNKFSKVYRIIAALYLPVALFDIYKSHAQQGLVVAALSVGLIGYFLLKAKVKSAAVRYGYLGLGVIAGLVAFFGALDKGPFSFLYKASITYRGDYWHAGIKMFFKHFWFGVGPDSYGDWYRASRTLAATVRRGPSTVSNAAHNVFLDVAATSGIFALLAYFAVIFLGFRAAWRITKRSNEFNPLFVGTFVAWVGYLIQSAISINNIALAIWGWVLPGLLIAMDRWASEPKDVKEVKAVKKIKGAKQNNGATDFSGMVWIMGLVVGAVIGFWPFNADANFRHAIESGDANKIYAAATKWPKDTSRILYAANIFNQNKLEDKAVSLARAAAAQNSRSFDAWAFLYSAKSVSGNEKREILDRMKALDPHNPDLKKLG